MYLAKCVRSFHLQLILIFNSDQTASNFHPVIVNRISAYQHHLTCITRWGVIFHCRKTGWNMQRIVLAALLLLLFIQLQNSYAVWAKPDSPQVGCIFCWDYFYHNNTLLKLDVSAAWQLAVSPAPHAAHQQKPITFGLMLSAACSPNKCVSEWFYFGFIS